MESNRAADPQGSGPGGSLSPVATLGVDEAASYLCCSVGLVYKLCATGQIEHQRIGNSSKSPIRFRKEWLDAFLAANHRKPAAVTA